MRKIEIEPSAIFSGIKNYPNYVQTKKYNIRLLCALIFLDAFGYILKGYARKRSIFDSCITN